MEHYYKNIKGSFDYRGIIDDYIASAKPDSRSLEIGAFQGKSSAYFGVAIINANKHLHHYVVDHFEGSREHQNPKSRHYEPELYRLKEIFLHNTDSVRSVITPIAKDSLSASREVPDDSLDFIFIDGAHDPYSLFQDIMHWYPKLKEGGTLAGHDIGMGTVRGTVQICFGKNYEVLRSSWRIKNFQPGILRVIARS